MNFINSIAHGPVVGYPNKGSRRKLKYYESIDENISFLFVHVFENPWKCVVLFTCFFKKCIHLKINIKSTILYTWRVCLRSIVICISNKINICWFFKKHITDIIILNKSGPKKNIEAHLNITLPMNCLQYQFLFFFYVWWSKKKWNLSISFQIHMHWI